MWPQIAEHIRAGIARGWDDLYSEWDIKRAVIDGAWQLWVAHVDDRIVAAAVTRIQDFPKARVFEVLLVGGGEMDRWIEEGLREFEEHGRRRGARLFQHFGRPGWGRITGGREACRVYVKEIA